MAGWRDLLRRKTPAPEAESVARVKAWVLEALRPPAGTALAVNEIACLDPACPGVETVILVMEPGRRTRACKVATGLDRVTEQAVRQALGG